MNELKKTITMILPKREVAKMFRVGVINTKVILDKKAKESRRHPKHRKSLLDF